MSPRTTKKDQQAIAPAPSVLDAVNASRGMPAPSAEPSAVETEPPSKPAPRRTVADKPAVVKAIVEPAPEPEPESVAARVSSADDAGSVGDLGQYVTRVMADARRAASEFLASVDVDAARRAALVASQAEIEARSVLEAAAADADKIRADARLEGDRLIAQRLRIAIDLTDQLYGQANRILADADRPDLARQQLAQFISALTQTAEDAAAAAKLDDKSRS